MCCVKYGVTSDFVIGLEVVLADGRVMRTGRRTVKGVAGYDLTHLLVGSEGTLGVVTQVTVRLVPAPLAPRTLVASFAQLGDAGAAVARIRHSGVVLSLMEILDRTTLAAVDQLAQMGLGREIAVLLLLQCDGADAEVAMAEVEASCIACGALDVGSSSDPVEATMLLEARRLALPALERLGHCLLDDVAVPPSRIVDLIGAVEEISARLGVVIGVFGHAGDGNMHPTVIFDDADPESRSAALTAFDAVTHKALELGGTITGEHGVGQLKRDWLARELDPTARAVHAAIKSALDPRGLLNPGTVIPAR
jgi:glycolate oxidase